MRIQEGLSSWSSKRVILACLLLIVGAPVGAAIGLLLGGLLLGALSGRHTISFTINLTNWTAAWLFLPPIVLVAAWIWSRRKSD